MKITATIFGEHDRVAMVHRQPSLFARLFLGQRSRTDVAARMDCIGDPPSIVWYWNLSGRRIVDPDILDVLRAAAKEQRAG